MTDQGAAPDGTMRPGEQLESGQAQWILSALNGLRGDLQASEKRLREDVQAAEGRLKSDLDGVGKRVRILERILFVGIGAAGIIGVLVTLLIRIIPFHVTISVQEPDRSELVQSDPQDRAEDELGDESR